MEAARFDTKFLSYLCFLYWVSYSSSLLAQQETQLKAHQELAIAAYNLDLTMVQSLLNGGVNPNRRAGIEQRLRICRNLGPARSRGFDSVGGADFTPLHAVACSPGPDAPPASYVHYAEQRVRIAEVLLKAGADPDAKDAEGRNALHIAIMNSNEELAIYLIHHGIDAARPCGPCNQLLASTPLQLATRNSKLSFRIMHELIRNGADVNEKAESGSTPLHIAATRNRYDMVSLLLENGADPYAVDDNGEIPQASIWQLFRDPPDAERIREALQRARAIWDDKSNSIP